MRSTVVNLDEHPLHPLLRPRSIAVVGASAKGNRGTRILQNLRRFNFAGTLSAVNPNARDIDGVPCFPSLRDLPDVPDFVAIAVPAAAAVEVAATAADMGVKAGLIIGGGFGEGAGQGKAEADRLRAICAETGLILCGPNCYGILNVHDGVAPFSGNIVEPLVPGHVGFVIQSGAISHAVHDSAIGRGLGISHVVTSGNELSVELSEYIDWMVEDDRTHVIATFIEGLKNPARFAQVAEKALAKGKPIIALKVGRTERGKRATLAHTGSVAGSDAAYEGMFQKLGVIRVDDVDEMREAILLFSSCRRPKGKGVAIASISGGMTSLLTDLSEMNGLSTPQPSETTLRQLNEILPAFGVANNPLDTTGALAERPEILGGVVSSFLSDPEVSVFALALNTPLGSEKQRTQYRTHARLLAEIQAGYEQPLVCFSMPSGAVDPEVQATLSAAGVPFLIGARPAVASIARWVSYEERRRLMAADRGRLADGGRIQTIEPNGRRFLAEREASELLAARGVPFVASRVARTADEAVAAARELGFPVVMKVNSPDISHKTEYGGVKLGLASVEDVAGAFSQIIDSVEKKDPQARIDGVLVQPMAAAGIEVLLGVTRDPNFGLQLVVGLGGIFVEVLKSVAMRSIPITEADAREMIAATPLSAMLKGFRGSGPADEDALVDAMLALSDAASDFGNAIQEIDINPFVVLPAGRGALALDGLIVIGEAD
ncbi:acetate--CoA ligase family protein (plasmid) [Rhizobium sp. NIBRBAC000502774]|nr:acetate--CoA ligase family protein [Rhizobium sp. NIBRBAC000502774]